MANSEKTGPETIIIFPEEPDVEKVDVTSVENWTLMQILAFTIFDLLIWFLIIIGLVYIM